MHASRNGNLDEFFKHENQACPPSISDQGNLRLPRQKSELASCLQALTTPKNAAPANCEVIIMDGAALVNMLKPTGKEKTFSEYASNKFIPYVTAQLQHVKRIDIVWDKYVENSLKATTRRKRGSGVRQLVAANNKLPRTEKNSFVKIGTSRSSLDSLRNALLLLTRVRDRSSLRMQEAY